MTIDLSPALASTLTKYFRYLSESTPDEYTQGTIDGFTEALKLLGITMKGVND